MIIWEYTLLVSSNMDFSDDFYQKQHLLENMLVSLHLFYLLLVFLSLSVLPGKSLQKYI